MRRKRLVIFLALCLLILAAIGVVKYVVLLRQARETALSSAVALTKVDALLRDAPAGEPASPAETPAPVALTAPEAASGGGDAAPSEGGVAASAPADGELGAASELMKCLARGALLNSLALSTDTVDKAKRLVLFAEAQGNLTPTERRLDLRNVSEDEALRALRAILESLRLWEDPMRLGVDVLSAEMLYLPALAALRAREGDAEGALRLFDDLLVERAKVKKIFEDFFSPQCHFGAQRGGFVSAAIVSQLLLDAEQRERLLKIIAPHAELEPKRRIFLEHAKKLHEKYAAQGQQRARLASVQYRSPAQVALDLEPAFSMSCASALVLIDEENARLNREIRQPWIKSRINVWLGAGEGLLAMMKDPFAKDNSDAITQMLDHIESVDAACALPWTARRYVADAAQAENALRMARLTFALRDYCAAHGGYPARLDAIEGVDTLDVASNAPFIYARKGGGFELTFEPPSGAPWTPPYPVVRVRGDKK